MLRHPMTFLLVSLLLVACGSEDSNNSGEGPKPQGEGTISAPPDHASLVERMPFSGLVAVFGDQSADVRILNPNLGAWSAPIGIKLDGGIIPLAFSPKGEQVVYAASDPSGQAWVVADLSIAADGTPQLAEAARIPTLHMGSVTWNARGDRFFTPHGWFNPSSGESVQCESPLGRLTASPDGRRFNFECEQLSTGLYDDGIQVYPAVLESVFSADGQFTNSNVHVPSLAELHADSKAEMLPFAAPDNSVYRLSDARRGRRSVQADGTFGAVIREWGPDPLVIWGDAATNLYAGQPGEARTQIELDLEAIMGGDGATARVAAFHPNGEDVIVAVSIWDTGTDSVNDISGNFYHTRRLARIGLEDGEIKSVHARGRAADQEADTRADIDGLQEDAPERNQLARRWPYGQAPISAIVQRDDRALMRVGNTWWGFDGDESMLIPWPAQMPTSDGRYFVGSFATGTTFDGTAIGGVCIVESEADSKVQCIRTQERPTIVGVGGHALPGLAQDKATIFEISQTAAFSGQEVVVLGTGFGSEPGRLTMGETEVTADSIVAWEDTQITLAIGPETPSGRLRIEGPKGFSDARPFYFHKTERLETGWEPETTTLDLRQGLNFLRHQGALAPWRPTMLNEKPFSTFSGALDINTADGGSLVYVNEAFASEASVVVGTQIGDWIRPVTTTYGPGVSASIEGWNPMGGETVLLPQKTSQFMWFLGKLTDVTECMCFERTDEGSFVNTRIRRPDRADPCPSRFVDEGDTALTIRTEPAVGPYFQRVSALEFDGAQYVMMFDPAVALQLPIGMSSFAELDDKRLFVGREENDVNSAAWAFDPVIGDPKPPEQTAMDAQGSLNDVVAIASGPMKGYLALEGRFSPAMAHFSPTAVPTWDWAPIPFDDDDLEAVRFWNAGSQVLAHRPGQPPERTSHRATVMNTADASPSWSSLVLPEGEVVSVYEDRPRNRMILASQTRIYEMPITATGFGEPTFLAEPTFDFFPVTITILNAGVMNDGSLFVYSQTQDDRPGATGVLPFGGAYFLPLEYLE